MSEIFEKFEIYGVPNSTEDAILASLMQGDPALLIGPPGTAKTEVLELIGSCLREDSKTKHKKDPDSWFKYKLYDTSKLNAEDLMGFPNPQSLMNGQMDFIKLPSSIWDKDFVVWDEINRCDKSRQSNLFEILRSRRLCGTPINTKFMFSSMNPFGDTGTTEMSDALADRHMFFIWFSSFSDMDIDDQLKVIERVGTHESVGVRYWGNKKYNLDVSDTTINEKLAETGKIIREIVTESVSIFDDLKKDISNKIGRLIQRITTAVAEEKQKNKKIGYFEISGRRASLMARGMLSMRAIQLAKAKFIGTEVPPLEGTLINSASMLIPIGIGQKISADEITRLKRVISDQVSTNYSIIFDNDENADKIYSIYYEKNQLNKLYSLLSVENIPKITHTKLWSELYEKNKDSYIEYMMVVINNMLPGTIPAHLNINNNILKDAKLTQKQPVGGIYKEHKDLINSIMANAQEGGKLLANTACAAILHLSNKELVTDNAKAIQNLTAANSLVTKIKVLMKKKLGTINEQPTTVQP